MAENTCLRIFFQYEFMLLAQYTLYDVNSIIKIIAWLKVLFSQNIFIIVIQYCLKMLKFFFLIFSDYFYTSVCMNKTEIKLLSSENNVFI